ncbi:uncharacterized protein LOC118564068 [Fundulus heteroclitus]|uniref:uncharacterized protein LOC118564068 n=1 Tax=Fundulus heteroclitus TaxID=8078 RepID=UPI00165AB177|nr:uncharacterized protein LOC118564068 [Fundulus heteroclitus]
MTTLTRSTVFPKMRNIEHLVKLYFGIGFTNKEILSLLAHQHQIIISIRTLKRLCKRLCLYRRKNQTDPEEIASFVEEELSGSGRLQGYRWLHLRAIQRGIVVSQNTMRMIIKILDPEGVELRRARRLRRRQYISRGPNALWHMDSYDKLKPFGIAINGCIDGFSRHIMWMEAYYTNSDPKVIADYFINTVNRIGGCPQQVRADPGTENGHVREMQMFLRRNHQDNYAGEGSFIYGCSTANQRIESWWGVLRKQSVQFWMDIFKTMRDDGYFTGSFLDRNLIQFCFLNLIQDELDKAVRTWNSHLIRTRPAHGTPGGRPILMFSMPQLYAAEDKLQPVLEEDMAVCREECTPKGQYPCDETVFELCILLMDENGWEAPTDAYAAAELYSLLRNEILGNL